MTLNPYNNTCIQYSVDPAKLNAGVPIEQLDKKNVRIVSERETLGMLNRYSQRTDRLARNPQEYKIPQPAAQPKPEPSVAPSSKKSRKPRKVYSTKVVHIPEKIITLSVDPADYNAVLNGRMIPIDEKYRKLIGKKIRITNKQTGSYRFFILCNVVGDRGYFL
ncbi:hypothetical protein [Anabaena sp. CCY 9910]|uniref:hypothetical protein n=1 Tax=Anabaena sp. CCY 9910 TaxID=3103870 RepID=UPI0039E0196D